MGLAAKKALLTPEVVTDAGGGGVFQSDSNAEHLILAVTGTNYQSAVTGGAWVNQTANIRSQEGVTANTGFGYPNTGVMSVVSDISGPRASYTSHSKQGTRSTSTAQNFYWSQNLDVYLRDLTLEMWIYFPTTGGTNPSILATNNFGGGGYPAWQAYTNSNYLYYFTNSNGTQYRQGAAKSNGVWGHAAWVFKPNSGYTTSNLKMFWNGTAGYNNIYGQNGGQSIVAFLGTYWDGYGASSVGVRWTDLRIYTTAKYSSNFTPDHTDPDLGGAILSP